MSRRFPRKFVPDDADMGDWSQIEPLFDRLDAAPIETVKQIEQWLESMSELSSCLSQEGVSRRVALTCKTDDPEREKAHLHYVENILPRCKPRRHKLNERYVASAARKQLASERYYVYDRSTVAAVEIYREENVPLQTEDSKLDQRYDKICAAMTVEYDGKEQTLQQMSRYLQQPDRKVRQEAWELVTQRRLQDREKLDSIYEDMVALRTQIAKHAGFDNFRDYQFKAYERFDYGPADCVAFHDAIAEIAVPAAREIQRERREKLGVDPLRPWDSTVDPENRPPLRPFEEASELSQKSSEVFNRVDPELGAQFQRMIEAGWLDLDSRKGKAPGGYQSTYDEDRRPFIFMNAVGLHRDVETLLHEGGHAFHSIACREDPLVAYRHCTMEMAEVASMGMEMLCYDHLDVFYAGDDLIRARREQLQGIISFFPWMAIIDAFQHWVYANPRHTAAERTTHWRTLLDRFGGIEDWSGYDSERATLWQRQIHLYSVPFYYVEYGIAQIGALQLWQNARKDKRQALRQYRDALALGGSRPLPELWETAGLKFDFSAATLRPLIEALQEELEKFEV